jgi:hypothetical protein
VHRFAPLGQADPGAGARSWLRREPQKWRAQDVFVDGRYVSPDTWYYDDQVHGARGEDPTEPPASAPYPFPAVSHEARIQQLSDDLEKAGLHPFHARCEP